VDGQGLHHHREWQQVLPLILLRAPEPDPTRHFAAQRASALERLPEVVPVWHTEDMKRPHASDDVRERALAAVDAGHRMVDVAAFFQNDPSTIRRWRRQRAATGSCRTRPRSGRPPVVKNDDEDTLRAQVAATPDATLAEHCTQWEAAGHGTIGIATMSRTLRRLGLTPKKRR
jgi:transposase